MRVALLRPIRVSLLSAEKREHLRIVADHIVALERLCKVMESRLVARDWDGLTQAIADSRRLTHGMQNAMEDASVARDALFDEQVFTRLRRVYAIRDEQMARLRHYQESIGERLRTFAKWKNFARSISARDATPTQSVGLDRLR